MAHFRLQARWSLTAAAPALAALALSGCAPAPGGHGHEHEDRGAAFERAYLEKDSIGKADRPGCSGVYVPDRGGFGGRVALTFDDGPNPATTPQVLETLRRHDAPATFFINGRSVATDADRRILRDIVADPSFTLANHSQTHRNFADLSLEEAANDVELTTAVIEGAGGEPHDFRFPYGSSTCETADLVRSDGYRVVGWHIDSADWCFASGDGWCPESTFQHVPTDVRGDMEAYVLRQVRDYDGGIVLFHDIHRYTAEHLDSILTELESRGYDLVGLGDAEAFPRLNGIEPPFVGTPCKTDDECTFREAAYCHASGFCTLSCDGYCPDAGGAARTFCVADPAAPGYGACVSEPDPFDGCPAIPDMVVRSVDRFVDESGAPVVEREVCVPG